MIVQIDIDHTITAAPEFFAWLTKALREDGHRILIVSSRTTSPENLRFSAQELRAFGIVFDELHLSPEVTELDPHRLPPGLHPAHRLYVYKLLVAQDHGADYLFDDCGITAELFQRYLPTVTVFRPVRKR